MRYWIKRVTIFATVLLAVYAAMAAWVYYKQEALLFFPDRLPPGYRFAIPGAAEVSVPVNGATLSALHFKMPNPKGVVFFLHGNGGSLASWFTNSAFYQRVNFDLFMIDYRGYGKSTGRIESEAQLRDDVRKAFAHIAPAYDGKRIVIYGRSLGTGLAAGLAADVQPDLTILVSPYYSMRDVARTHYPYLPSGLLRYSLETWRDLPRIRRPAALIHGELDSLIPVSHSTRLHSLVPQNKLLLLPQAAHNDVHEHDTYREFLADLLNAL